MNNAHGGVRLSLEEFIRFNQELEGLARTRLPLGTGVRRMATELKSSRALRSLATDVAAGLERGQSLSEALQQSGHQFPRVYLEMIRVGERSESLGAILNTVVRAGRQEQEMHSAVRTLLTYPAFIICASVVVVTILSVYVVPHFQTIYGELGAELPGLTIFLVSAVSYLRGWGVLGILVVPVFVILAVRLLYGLPPVRRMVDAAIYRIPLIGPMVSVHHAGQWCRALGELLLRGVPLDESLDFAADAMPNLTLRQLSLAAAAHVRRGGRMVVPLEDTPAIPSSYRWMLGRAEERGDLGETCRELADLAESNTAYFRQRAFLFFEPIVLVVIGLCVAVVIVALYLPLFTLPRLL